ncbi:hypothetical protein GW17_00052238 [Ensete ventricosum]|nr:hypothetical protein GW17_00052238 [Ensete ventricosum]RZS20281.1 hypothetical protein BHM03_00052775 [Ensete ventricosum]
MTDGKTRSLVEQKEWSILLDRDQYLPNSDECDRILWVGEGLKQNRYERCESKLSDHRAVRAVFTAEVDVLKLMNSLDEFFLSHNFDDIVDITRRMEEEI